MTEDEEQMELGIAGHASRCYELIFELRTELEHLTGAVRERERVWEETNRVIARSQGETTKAGTIY